MSEGDVIFNRNIRISATIGTERWARAKPQPALISFALPAAAQIAAAAASDDVADTVNYSYMYKFVAALDGQEYATVDEFALVVARWIVAAAPVSDVSDVALEVCLPAASLRVDPAAAAGGGGSIAGGTASVGAIGGAHAGLVWQAKVSASASASASASVSTHGDGGQPGTGGGRLHAGTREVGLRGANVRCIIGINPHERRDKQSVVVDVVCKGEAFKKCVNHAALLEPVFKMIEDSTYRSVEALAVMVANEVLAQRDEDGQGWERARVGVRKPHAYVGADGPAVEVTRVRQG